MTHPSVLFFLLFSKIKFIFIIKSGRMGTSMIVPEHVENKMTQRGRSNNKGPNKNHVIGDRKDEALQKLVNQLPKIVVPLQESKNKEEPKTEVTEAVASLPSTQQPLQNQQEKLHGQEKENLEEKQLSIWKNLSNEALSHFKKADHKRKQSIMAKSGLKQENPVEKAQPCVLNDQVNNNTFSDIHSDRPNDFALSVHSKIKEAPQRKEEAFLKKAIKKRILLPNVEIVSSVKEKRKLKLLYNNEQVIVPEQKWRATS